MDNNANNVFKNIMYKSNKYYIARMNLYELLNCLLHTYKPIDRLYQRSLILFMHSIPFSVRSCDG